MLEALPGRSLKSRMRLGLFAFDESFTLRREPGVDGVIRIGLALSLANQVAVVSGSLDRFAVRRLASEIAEQTLSALRDLCEEPADGPPKT